MYFSGLLVSRISKSHTGRSPDGVPQKKKKDICHCRWISELYSVPFSGFSPRGGGGFRGGRDSGGGGGRGGFGRSPGGRGGGRGGFGGRGRGGGGRGGGGRGRGRGGDGK